MGFAFLGVVIGYMPVVYSFVFAPRNSDFDTRCARGIAADGYGTVGAAGRDFGESVHRPVGAGRLLRDWERWSAELLESHISYPALSFFRSQHSNQSWLGALMTMLDVTSLLLAGIEGIHPAQAKLTFAMARHAAVDLAQVVNARYDPRLRNGWPMRISTASASRSRPRG